MAELMVRGSSVEWGRSGYFSGSIALLNPGSGTGRLRAGG